MYTLFLLKCILHWSTLKIKLKKKAYKQAFKGFYVNG